MTILTNYRAADEPLSDLLTTLTDHDWAAESPCDGWTAADVVAHLIGTQAAFLAGAGIETAEPGDVTADPAGAWTRHATATEALLGRPEVVNQDYQGMFGPSTVGDTLDTFYVFDMVAHRWDIARAAGRAVVFTDAELDRLEAAIAAFGDHLYLDGICKPGTHPGAGASRQDTILAALGRKP